MGRKSRPVARHEEGTGRDGKRSRRQKLDRNGNGNFLISTGRDYRPVPVSYGNLRGNPTGKDYFFGKICRQTDGIDNGMFFNRVMSWFPQIDGVKYAVITT